MGKAIDLNVRFVSWLGTLKSQSSKYNTMDVFAKAIELPTLSDAGIAAIAANRPRAVAAIARALKRQEAAQFAKLEEIWGQN